MAIRKRLNGRKAPRGTSKLSGLGLNTSDGKAINKKKRSASGPNITYSYSDKELQEEEEEEEKEEVEVEGKTGEEDSNDEYGTTTNRTAYNALLTLLQPTNPEKANKKTRLAKNRIQTSSPNVIDELDQLEQENQEQKWTEKQLTLLENQNEDDGDGEIDEELMRASYEEIVVDDDNEDDMSDPFEWHFAKPDPAVINAFDDLPNFKSSIYPENTSFGAKSIFQLCSPNLSPLKMKPISKISSLRLKYRLEAPFKDTNGEILTTIQKDIASPMFSYQDILFPLRSYENEEELQNLYLVHILNHIYKTRDRILKNNARLSKNPEGEYRDQGFTRPKVLILLPTKDACYQLFNRLEAISGLKQTENKKRFKESFFDPSKVPENKPTDFQKFFKGNTGDLFCLGVKFTRLAIKLYSSFYSSDLILASPLGLRLIIGTKGDKKQDYDFLSSIEVMIVDQADKMQMQSWDNVEHIFQYMNSIPKDSHGCDFSRLRNWYIDDKAKLERQTLLFTDYSTPEINNCFNHHCHNVGGKLRVRPVYRVGSMSQIGLNIRQTYTRINPENPMNDPDVRFKHFTSSLLPSLLRGASLDGVLVFIPSYMDYLRVRNYMDENNLPATWICEYSNTSNLSRSRAYLADGRVKILLYTERLHHYRRFNLKGVKQLIFYGLPDNPVFYKEAMRWLVRSYVELDVPQDILRARIIYSQWDVLKLERIVGTPRVGPLIKGTNDIFEFY